MAVNLGFLAVDIVLAHSVNHFEHPAEWVPLGFSVMSAGILFGLLFRRSRAGRAAGMLRELVGWSAVAVGVAGLLFHLESAFFERATLQSLVYSAPFVAPLAYTGLGLLLLLNRRSDPDAGAAWGQWVVFLALAGVVGNFGLSLADHAQNGFFRPTEWIPVGAAAFGIGALSVVVLRPWSHSARRVGWVGVGVQAVTGVLGFVLHVWPALDRRETVSLFEAVVYGAPPFAPLLFTNLALLAALGMLALGPTRPDGATDDADPPFVAGGVPTARPGVS